MESMYKYIFRSKGYKNTIFVIKYRSTDYTRRAFSSIWFSTFNSTGRVGTNSNTAPQSIFGIFPLTADSLKFRVFRNIKVCFQTFPADGVRADTFCRRLRSCINVRSYSLDDGHGRFLLHLAHTTVGPVRNTPACDTVNDGVAFALPRFSSVVESLLETFAVNGAKVQRRRTTFSTRRKVD